MDLVGLLGNVSERTDTWVGVRTQAERMVQEHLC